MRRELVAPLGPAEGEFVARPASLRVEVPLEVRLPIREVVEQLGREVELPPVAALERQLDPVLGHQLHLARVSVVVIGWQPAGDVPGSWRRFIVGLTCGRRRVLPAIPSAKASST